MRILSVIFFKVEPWGQLTHSLLCVPQNSQNTPFGVEPQQKPGKSSSNIMNSDPQSGGHKMRPADMLAEKPTRRFFSLCPEGLSRNEISCAAFLTVPCLYLSVFGIRYVPYCCVLLCSVGSASKPMWRSTHQQKGHTTPHVHAYS